MVKLQAGERLIGDDEIFPREETPQCQLCQMALHYLQNYLDTPKTEQEIKDYVDHM